MSEINTPVLQNTDTADTASHHLKTGSELQSLVNRHLKESKQNSKIPLIVVIGPTASGKTDLGIALANRLDGEIISADSRQIYREMAIGTAQPTREERKQACHHMIDFINPDQQFSLADFQQQAGKLIRGVYLQKKIPILVGGTGLYISAITENYSLPDSKPDTQLRMELEKLASEKGREEAHRILEKIDQKAAQSIHPNNLRYVIRAIEIARQTNQGKIKNRETSPYHPVFLTVEWPREVLYKRIEKRIDRQLEQGLLEETKNLLSKFDGNLPALSSLGYQELSRYLTGDLSRDEAVELFKQNTRNFAKRQMTWFRKFPQVYSIPGEEIQRIIDEMSIGK